MEMESDSASLAIANVVLSWPNVTSEIGDLKQLVFKVHGHEIGQLHGNTLAHFRFDPGLWFQLRRAGRIEDHPVFPCRPGPAQRRIKSAEDLRDVIALLRLNYDALAAAPD